MGDYEVQMDGGGPWGIRLQGGKDFGVQLNVARVTPGSKAALKGLLAGDTILAINNTETENLSHMDAQNLIKNSKDRLQLRLRQGPGASDRSVVVGSSGFAPTPNKTLYQTDVTHSAAVDHKYNAAPKPFTPAISVSSTTVSSKKFDPAEYARRKKEELERYKEDKTRPLEPDSEVLQMLKKTSVGDKNENQNATGSFNKLQKQLANEGQYPQEDLAFRMTAEGTDLSDVSPASRAVMEDIKSRGGTTGLVGGNTGASGGSRSFRYLQHLTSQDEDLPPPPPELMGGGLDDDDDDDYNYRRPQSNSFNLLQHHVEAGTTDQIKTPFDKPTSQPARSTTTIRINPSRGEVTTVNPVPKAPFPSGPNFTVGRAAAPTFKPTGSGSNIGMKAPPPPAVNAGEIVNPNSRFYQPGTQPSPGYQDENRRFSGGNAPPSSYGKPQTPPYGSRSPPSQPSPPAVAAPYGRGGTSPNQSNEKKLVCHSCQQPLGGPFVSAIGKTWHPEHFCCSSCRTSLQNQAFVEENNQLFCEKCYNQFYAPKCAHCNNAIIGNCVNALGKSWHPDHFVCTVCMKSFGSEGFLVDSGKPYCEKCFENIFSVKCGKCNRPVTGGERYVEALNKNWHQDCFSCTACNIRLEGNSFFVSGMPGMPYCQLHKGGL